MPPLTGIARRLAAALTVIVALAVAGCTGLTPVNAVTNEAMLLNELIDRLRARMADLGDNGYTATYQLAGGLVGQIMQRADSASFGYPDGNLILTATHTATCTRPAGGGVTCALSAPQPAAPAAIFTAVTTHGLVTAPVLMDLLQTAANRPTWLSEQHDTTITGLSATCVSISPTDEAGAYTACVTTDGLIGSFAGKLGGVTIDQNLTAFADSAPQSAFEIPLGASITNGPT